MSQSHTTGDTGEAPYSVCLFCGSSAGSDPQYVQAAVEFGQALASAKMRLVYGGGGIGLMGAAAKSAHQAHGQVLGVMPDFLRRHEVIYDEVETVIVATMHDRKRIMFENSNAFAVFPGGVGTLEEVVELMSWRRLDLHRKPVVFLDLNGFWEPLFSLMTHMVERKFAPPWISDTWASVRTVAEVLPMIARLQEQASAGPGFFGYAEQNAEVGSRL